MAITEQIDNIMSHIKEVKEFVEKVKCVSCTISRFTVVLLTSLLISAIIDNAQWFLRLFSIMAITYVGFDLLVWKRDRPKQAEKKSSAAPGSLVQIMDRYDAIHKELEEIKAQLAGFPGADTEIQNKINRNNEALKSAMEGDGWEFVSPHPLK